MKEIALFAEPRVYFTLAFDPPSYSMTVSEAQPYFALAPNDRQYVRINYTSLEIVASIC